MQKSDGNILIIDDDKDVLLSTRIVLKKHFRKVITESNPENISTLLKTQHVDVILLDMNFTTGATSGKEGLFWLKKIIASSPDSIVVMMTAYGDINLAVKTMKEGATDFIVKPWENKKLVATTNMAFKLSQSNKKITELEARQNVLKREIDKPFSEIIGESKALKAIFKSIDKVAKTDANVLILGENGTGKELAARAIHKKSMRADQIFVNVDLGAIPESLFESELFGHEKGAFTDAKESRAGRFELASGGTLFLDEIGNLPFALQSKLLSVIQNREVFRIGSNNPIPIDIRLISATNKTVEELKNESKFRQDLLYRINTVELKLPSLEERKEDIPLLTNHFLNVYANKYGKQDVRISKEAIQKLKRFNWPGNIRELQHVIERAVIMSEGKTLKPFDFSNQNLTTSSTEANLNLEELEKIAIMKALRKHNGNLSSAAKILGLGRTTLYRKMKKYDL